MGRSRGYNVSSPSEGLLAVSAARPPISSAVGRRRTSTVILAAFACLTLGPACENGGGGGRQKSTDKRMSQSTGDFNTGYQDGKRDAGVSLMKAKAAAMWLWMKPDEYRKGYDQGWSDAWKRKELESKQPEQQKQKSSSGRKDQQSQQKTAQGGQTLLRPVRMTTKDKPATTKARLVGQQ